MSTGMRFDFSADMVRKLERIQKRTGAPDIVSALGWACATYDSLTELKYEHGHVIYHGKPGAPGSHVEIQEVPLAPDETLPPGGRFGIASPN